MTRSTVRPGLLLIMFLTPLLAVSAVEPFRARGSTTADGLRVRREPTLTGEIAGSLAAATDLEILDLTSREMVVGTMTDRWYRVRSLPPAEAIDGWSYGAFIDVAREDLLAVAIWAGNEVAVRGLIDSGANVNARLEEDGALFTLYEEYSYLSTPLMEAVLAGEITLVRLLLEAGADPDTGNTLGEPGGSLRSNALVTAASRGDLGIVRVLVDAGADLESEMSSFGGGGDGFNATALSAAVTNGDVDLVEYLIDSGADVNYSVKYWSTFGAGDSWKSPLDLAAEGGEMEIFFILEDAGGAASGE